MRERDTLSEDHWTHKLFVENTDLYLPFPEQTKERAQREIEALFGLSPSFAFLSEAAFPTSSAASAGTARF